jgi:hypothetical protein
MVFSARRPARRFDRAGEGGGMTTRALALAATGVAILAATAVHAGNPAGNPAPAAITNPCGTKPAPMKCYTWVCTGAGWEPMRSAAGTACDDGNLCTYSDVCDGSGFCSGTPSNCVPAGPCETSACTGTASCVVAKRPAGTACPLSTNPCEAVCDGQSAFCQPQ